LPPGRGKQIRMTARSRGEGSRQAGLHALEEPLFRPARVRLGGRGFGWGKFPITARCKIGKLRALRTHKP
jgi:hypothetical protein